MKKEFEQLVWDDRLRSDVRQLVSMALREDLGDGGDYTTQSLIGRAAAGQAVCVARQSGVVAGLEAAQLAIAQVDPAVKCELLLADGTGVDPDQPLVHLAGPAGSLLTSERLVLNLLGRLSGIATQTRSYVDRVAGTKARIYDTRKTTPGWRRLEKYAVRQGGGCNHRQGLFDAVLIKDNHLALVAGGAERMGPGEAVKQARRAAQARLTPDQFDRFIVEVEVDRLDQLDDALAASPDIVLLDNMSPATLREAVGRRDQSGADVDLEASGGVTLDTIAQIAATGVDRISVGALTHSAHWLDIGLDWQSG